MNLRHLPRILTAVGLGLVLGAGTLTFAVNSVSAQTTGDAADVRGVQFSPAEIAQWVKQLDDDRFNVRTRATDQLILAGAAAVEPVAQAVEQGKLEVSMRAVYVLRELALSFDVTAQQLGLDALQNIAGSERRSAARLAREAILALGDLRQKQSLEQLAKLGATIRGYGATGFASPGSLEVEIGADWEGTLQDLRRLGWLRDLSKITFEGAQVDDQWIATIKDLGTLTYVAIKNAKVTDESLRIISRLKSVVYVDLMYTPVTDTGLEYLKEMKSVRKIRCFGTKITRDAADRFQAELASVVVQHKLGAFLGVSCQQPPWPCEVTRVTANSAADNAGVKVNDIIVEYDGKPVGGFDDLEKLIALNRVGDSVEIVVARNGKPWIALLPTEAKQGLGLDGETTAIGTRVKKVSRDGLAAKAGIRVGDVIVALDDVRVESSDQFHKLYKQKVPVPNRQVQILRDIKRQKMRVTFGQWDEL